MDFVTYLGQTKGGSRSQVMCRRCHWVATIEPNVPGIRDYGKTYICFRCKHTHLVKPHYRYVEGMAFPLAGEVRP